MGQRILPIWKREEEDEKELGERRAAGRLAGTPEKKKKGTHGEKKK